MRQAHSIVACQTHLLHWKQEPESHFEGENQASVYYEFDLQPPQSTEQERASFTVLSILEVLNQYKGVIVNAQTQTEFTIDYQGDKPSLTCLLECTQLADQAFFKVLEEKKAGTPLAHFTLKKPAPQEIERNLAHSLQVQYG